MEALPRRCSGQSRRSRLAAVCAVLLAAGCTRTYYHDYADNDSYHILRERGFDWRWRVPERPVEASPYSRMADLNDPNHVPIVPDEVAARKFQVSARFPFEYRFWKDRGTTPIEDLSWQPYVPLESDGKILLSKDSIMRIGMINSRDYQFAYENLYLSGALADACAVSVHDSRLQQLGALLHAAGRRRRGVEQPDRRARARRPGVPPRRVQAQPRQRPRPSQEPRPRRHLLHPTSTTSSRWPRPTASCST